MTDTASDADNRCYGISGPDSKYQCSNFYPSASSIRLQQRGGRRPRLRQKATLGRMLDHVLVGPTKDQDALYNEVKQLLSANGLGNVRVHKSDIPYRSDL